MCSKHVAIESHVKFISIKLSSNNQRILLGMLSKNEPKSKLKKETSLIYVQELFMTHILMEVFDYILVW